MDLQVSAVQIAQGFQGPAALGLADESSVTGAIQFRPGHGKTKLKRHIEPGRVGAVQVQVDAREVVNRIAATSHKVENSIQAPFSAGYAEGGSRLKTELAQSDDIGQIETTEPIVIGNIQKNSIWLDWRNRHGISDLDHFLVLKTVAFSRMVPDASR